MGGTAAATARRREAIREIMAAGKVESVPEIQQALESDYGITVSVNPIYLDLGVMGIEQPQRSGKAASNPAPKKPRKAAPKRTPAPAKPTPRPGAKPAADGYQRTSLDLPNGVYERLKIAALMDRRPFREIIEQAAIEWLDRNDR